HRTSGKDRKRIRAGEVESIGAVGRQPQRRMRPLQRTRNHFDIVQLIKTAVKIEALLAPGPQDTRQHLLEALAAAAHIDAITAIVAGKRAAPGAQLAPPTREPVERGDSRGEPHRMMQRKQVDGDTQAQPRSSLSYCGEL